MNRAFLKRSRMKQYLKYGHALRIEAVVYSPRTWLCQRGLIHLDELQAKARAVKARLIDTERVGQGCVPASPALSGDAVPTLTADARRAPT